jgi:hypothetical protein
MAKNQYLQRRHQGWYVVVEVPRHLRKAVGKRRLFRSLHTRDVNEANRLKHPHVAEFKQFLHTIANAPDQAEAKVLAKALTYRKEFLAANPKVVEDLENGETFSSREFVVDDIMDEARTVQAKFGREIANRFTDVALARNTPFGQLPELWLKEIKGQVAEQTRSQHKVALKNFREWLGEPFGIEDVTRDAAHLMLTVNAAVAEGITSIATVHDSFGCLPSRAERFRRIIREQFVKMYQEHDVLQEVFERAKEDLRNAKVVSSGPPRGSLDIKQVLGAEYAFS